MPAEPEGQADLALGVLPSGRDGDPLQVQRIAGSDQQGLVVYVPAGALRERDVAPGVAVPDGLAMPTLAEVLRLRLDARAEAVHTVREVFSAEMRRRTRMREAAAEHTVRLLGGSPRAGMQSDRFVPAGADATAVVRGARQAGVRRMSTLNMTGMTLRVDTDALLELGVQLGADGRLLDEQMVPRQQLAQYFMMAATGEVAIGDPLLRCGVDSQVEQFVSGVGGDAPPPAAGTMPTDDEAPTAPISLPGGNGATGSGDGEAGTGTASGAATPLADLIDAKLRHLVESIGKDAPLGVRATPSALTDSLSAQLAGGPADVPATHDFHSLQIAWEDVWTAVVDGELADQMAEAYRQVVEVVDWPAVSPDLSDITELNEFLGSLSTAIETAAGIGEELGAPAKTAELLAWVPELGAKWDALSQLDRAYMWVLFWIDRINWASVGYSATTTLKNYIDLWDIKDGATDPFGEPLWRLREIGQTHPEWLAYKVVEIKVPHWGRDRALSILAGYQPSAGVQPQHTPAVVTAGLERLRDLIRGIAVRLAEPYRFDVFKPCTHNFGLITTYRQNWKPLTYQVGEMVGAIALTPGEKRKYTKKRVVRTSRAQKEIEKALSTRHGESTETSRAESEILRKASYSTNFNMSASGGFTVGVVNARVGAQYAANQGVESSRVKKDFHEAVRKASQEYRDERTIEISTEETITAEVDETAEISNENNELPVTYLFYELQRRYEISERLHKITPVILVAFDVPSPHRIDEAWLLTHEWILRRVLLDDGLLPALDVLGDSFAGDELAVEVHRVHWQTQIRVVQQLQEGAAIQTRAQQLARAELGRALQTVATGGGGLFDTVGDFLFGDSDSGNAEAVEARRQAAQKALEWAEADLAAANERLNAAVTALQMATDAYTSALQRRLNRRVAIDQLRLHVKQNILYYMQAIWLHEPPDQRYLRIYEKEVEWPEPEEPYYTLRPVSEVPPTIPDLPGGDDARGLPPNTTWVKVLVTPPVLGPTRRLHEVADIDNLLGFKGNYAIFPLREGNGLTEFMCEDFLDSYFRVQDPDPFGQLPTPTEAVDIAECAWNTPGITDEDKRRITNWLVAVLDNQRRVAETIVVPTGQVFVEALPGRHPVLEDFKLRHRQIDVHRARAAATQEDIEALRYAARIGASQLGDPEVQTQIVMPDGAGVSLAVGPGPGTPP